MDRRKIRLSANLVILGSVALVIAATAIWIQIDRTGEVRGQVVYADGTPAAGVRVRLRERMHNLIGAGVFEYTGPDGRFTYTDLEMIEFIIDAAEEDAGLRSESERHHLYFKGQDFELPEPLVLGKSEE